MPILSDCHLHTHHSGDSEAPMEDMIRRGIELGLTTMCFTEHNDFGFPEYPDLPADAFLLNVDSYLYELLALREKYAGQIKLLFGLELGLQPEVFRENAILARSYEFDFIIGSSHLVNGKDPYYPDCFEGRTDEEVYRAYFEAELANVRKFSNFDVYGHLDYIVRYGPQNHLAAQPVRPGQHPPHLPVFDDRQPVTVRSGQNSAVLHLRDGQHHAADS